jgi:4-hydroxybenzoate polyprenyltransferase
MIGLYPWMKRITYWPQLFLGLTMNMGLIIGIYTVGLNLEVGIISMYAGMISWTFGYDTIYGFQDMEDDILIGIKSTTFKVRASPKIFIAIVYGVSIFLWLLAGKVMGLLPFYYLGIGSIFILFLWQILTLEPDNAANCLIRFRSNQWISVLLFLSIILKDKQ